MPQSPLAATIATKRVGSANVQAAAALDATNNQLVGQGSLSALNQTAAAVIKASPGRVCKVIVLAGGSGSGNFTLNDCITTGTATAANAVWTLPFGAAAGSIYSVDFPFAVGITLSAVPAAGSPICAISYT